MRSTFAIPFLGRVSFGGTVEKRLQLIAMYSYSLYFMLPMVALCWWCTGKLLLRGSWSSAVVACYLGWIFLLDDSPTTGSRRPFLRGLRSWWSYACDYFPILLVKTADLDPSRRYVMGYHPHGIISVGAFGAFATDGPRTLTLGGTKPAADDSGGGASARGFSELFPGIDRRLITLPQNFRVPFLREYILSLGCCDSSRETFRTVLARGPGSAVVVVVGGAEESMIVNPGSIELVLERRRGFVREAIMAGACLVPVVAYGENDVYRVSRPDDDSHWVARFQRKVKRITGFAMPIFEGRSLFFRDFGLMPKRRPINVVVGAPIEPPPLDEARRASFRPQLDRKTSEPLNEDGRLLDELHTKYVAALVELYKKYKVARWNEPGLKMRGTLTITK